MRRKLDSSQIAICIALATVLMVFLAVDSAANRSWSLLCGAGFLGFAYIALTQRAETEAGRRIAGLAVLVSGAAAVLWLVPLGFGLYYGSFECASGDDSCGLGRALTYYFFLACASATSVIAALTWLVYFAARRSAETE